MKNAQTATARLIKLRAWTALLGLCLLLLAGCGPQKNAAANSGNDAYVAARNMVLQSLKGDALVVFGEPGRDAQSGVQQQTNGTWKVWSWVSMQSNSDPPTRWEWKAVMEHLGQGRKWRARWLKIDDQESGDSAAWEDSR